MTEKIAILGSTGSIGTNTLQVIQEHPEHFTVVALAAGRNISRLIDQIQLFRPQLVSVQTKELAEQVRERIGHQVRVTWGEEGLIEVATHPDATFVVSSLVGSLGLKPTLAAIQAGKKIGLANKETLVTAGHIVTQEADKRNVAILPIDSEHSAIFQCLHGEHPADVKRIIITASGGAFRDRSRTELVDVTPEEALAHPNWSMGAKVTVDSATMMNKGLEVIEAHWLFAMPYEQIDVIIHPESIIHSMVEFQDGAVMAQLGVPDMKVPIQYALSYPRRYFSSVAPLDFTKLKQLHFQLPDFERFPCLRLAYEAGKEGGSMPTVLNAANEVAVGQFLARNIPFLKIEEVVEKTLAKHDKIKNPSLEVIEAVDRWAREYANQLCS